MNTDIWLVPEYYDRFHCKADKCRHTCCSRWKIPVDRETYNRLITMDCSPELNRSLNTAFVLPETVSDDHYRIINHNWLGECPMLCDGLCLLLKEKGEAFLPEICRLFPPQLQDHKRSEHCGMLFSL